MRLATGIIITKNPNKILNSLEALRNGELFTIIRSENEKGEPKEFQLPHAKETIAKAFVASKIVNYIILIAPSFSEIAQNRLLKILEEPPKNKEFIIITESKSAILDTIKSRMPIKIINDSKPQEELSLDINSLNLAKVYEFSQKNSRVSSIECKKLVERISTLAIKSGKYTLDKSTLELFSNSIKALDKGSPTLVVLNTVLLKLLSKKC